MIYQTLDHSIHDQALTIKNDKEESVNIRPKTCQLLLLLLKSKGTPVSKQTILDTIWAGSIVSEQVVFQSINEIRQLFPEEVVIKTIPKKGYVWLHDVQSIELEKQQKEHIKRYGIRLSILLIIICSYLILHFFSENKNNIDKSKINGSIVILPINNQLKGNSHNWVRLGMMDQVIQQLPNSKNNAVLQTDYVLEVLNRADVSVQNVVPAQINKIFRVSGAELIVQSKLSGTPHDYQLNYTFYYRNSVQKGVLFNKKVSALIDNLSLLVLKQLSHNKQLNNANTYKEDFNNELLGVAINHHLEGKYAVATPLLKSIVLENPQNLTAQRVLVNNLTHLKQFEQAQKQIEAALPIAKRLGDTEELTRLLYSKALLYYVTYNDEKAGIIASEAFSIAKENNDWLLMAHITNIKGNLALNRQEYELAEAFYMEELQYHQILHCPVGQANSWGNLAKLANHQNNPIKFKAAINKALDIANKRELTSQLNYFNKLKENEG